MPPWESDFAGERVTRVKLLPDEEGEMQHDVIFANQTAKFTKIDYSRPDRQISGPPMIKMMGAAFAIGLLITIGIASTGVVSLLTGMGVWWATSIAVLAIESPLYTWFTSSSIDVRASFNGCSTISAAS